MQFFHGCERIAKWCYSHEQKGKKYIESLCDGVTGQYHDSGADRSQRMDRLVAEWAVSHADMVSYNDRTWCRGSISQCLLSDKVLLFRRHEKGA